MATQLDHEVTKLRRGDHLCPVHNNLAEQTASAVAFIAADLRNGERCLYGATDSPFEELILDAGYYPDSFCRIHSREFR